MNRKAIIYLCGPIQNRTDEQCVTWRREAALRWPGETLDPLRRDYRGRELENPAALVADDLADLISCDGVLVYFDAPSVGTAMEIFYAKHILHKPIVVIDATEGAPLSPWLVHHTDRMAPDLTSALVILHHLIHERWMRYAR